MRCTEQSGREAAEKLNEKKMLKSPGPQEEC